MVIPSFSNCNMVELNKIPHINEISNHGAFAGAGQKKTATFRERYHQQNKVVPSLEEAIRRTGLKDGMTIGDGLHNGPRLVEILLTGHEHLVQRFDLTRIDDGLTVKAQLFDEGGLSDEALLVVDIGEHRVQRGDTGGSCGVQDHAAGEQQLNTVAAGGF